jgi:hypothetical protein
MPLVQPMRRWDSQAAVNSKIFVSFLSQSLTSVFSTSSIFKLILANAHWHFDRANLAWGRQGRKEAPPKETSYTSPARYKLLGNRVALGVPSPSARLYHCLSPWSKLCRDRAAWRLGRIFPNGIVSIISKTFQSIPRDPSFP